MTEHIYYATELTLLCYHVASTDLLAGSLRDDRAQ